MVVTTSSDYILQKAAQDSEPLFLLVVSPRHKLVHTPIPKRGCSYGLLHLDCAGEKVVNMRAKMQAAQILLPSSGREPAFLANDPTGLEAYCSADPEFPNLLH